MSFDNFCLWPFLPAFVELDVAAFFDGVAVVDVDVVAVVDVAAMYPSSTEWMSSVEAGALTPGPRDQVGCLSI